MPAPQAPTRALDFRALFEASPNPYMVLDRELRYVAANRAYLEATASRLEDLLGRHIIEAFPHDPDDPNNESARRLRASFEKVIATGQPDALPFIHYRIPVTRDGARVLESFYWSATHTPIVGPDAEVAFVLQHTVNVTELARAQREGAAGAGTRAIHQVSRMLDAQQRLFQVFEQAPGFLCYLRGPDHVFEIANAAYLQLVGHRDILRRPIAEALPEVATQGFVELLDQVRRTGQPYIGQAMRVALQRRPGAPLEERFVDYVYQPIEDETGSVAGILVQGNDVTERKRAELELSKLASVLEATHDFVGIADLDGNPLFVNRAGLELVGMPDLEAARRTPVVEYFVEEQHAFVAEEVLPAVIRDGHWEGELAFRSMSTRDPIPVLYSVFVLRDDAGTPIALATITRDLRAAKRAEGERAQLLESERLARAQAEEANRLKDEFLATVSHELRTPLSAILGWTHLLRAGGLPVERRARALETVERNAKIQAQLIEDLLDVSRIVSGKLTLDLRPLDVSSVVAAAVETVRTTADVKGVRLEVEPESSGAVLGDADRLQQVIWNLLSNAVKFTPAGGSVRVAVRRRAEAVEIEVRDTGVGIAPSFLSAIFEPFRQADVGASRRSGGLGLGLAIVRHLVAAHGGTIEASSEGEGRGSTFVLTLPLAAAPRGAPDDETHRALEYPAALCGLHVLVVDDERDSREYVMALLTACRARVTAAASAAEAFDAVTREPPDLIVSDIAMPIEDGYSLIRRIRALTPEHGGRTPAIALTAFARAEDRARAMRSGYQNHVTKPTDPAELLAALTSLAPWS